MVVPYSEPLTLAVARSRNGKTAGSVTYRDRSSCGPCPLWDGCYAAGRIAAMPERTGLADPAEALAPLHHLPEGSTLRLGVVGDLFRPAEPTEPGAFPTGRGGFVAFDDRHASAVAALTSDRPDLIVWTYTHGWRFIDPDPLPGVVVNASCETAADVAEALAAGWQATVVDDPEAPLAGTVVAGRRVVTCPAITGKAASCAECRLCASDAPRRAVVAFPVHGPSRKRAASAVRARREE